MKRDSERFLIDKLIEDSDGIQKMPELLEKVEKQTGNEETAFGTRDGHYPEIGDEISVYFSDFSCVGNQVLVAVEWLIFLINSIDIVDDISVIDCESEIEYIYDSFDQADYCRFKELECTNKQKAVEFLVAEKLQNIGLGRLSRFVNFGCSSEDVENIANVMMISDALEEVWIPKASKLIDTLATLAYKYSSTPMLVDIYNQPIATTFGKEMVVYCGRLRHSLNNIAAIKPRVNFSGTSGNYSDIAYAYPKENWITLCTTFITETLEMNFNQIGAVTDSQDHVVNTLDGIRHFNNILKEFLIDMQSYICDKHIMRAGTKTCNSVKTCIRNSKALLKNSNSVCLDFSDELPQFRTKSDVGRAFDLSLQAIEQAIKGVKMVYVNDRILSKDLNDNWSVLAEPINTIFSKYGIMNAYDQIQEQCNGEKVSKEEIHKFVNSFDILSNEDRTMLLALTPLSCVGYANSITKSIVEQLKGIEKRVDSDMESSYMGFFSLLN